MNKKSKLKFSDFFPTATTPKIVRTSFRIPKPIKSAVKLAARRKKTSENSLMIKFIIDGLNRS